MTHGLPVRRAHARLFCALVASLCAARAAPAAAGGRGFFDCPAFESNLAVWDLIDAIRPVTP